MSTERPEDPRLLAAAEALSTQQMVNWERLREECGDAAVEGLRAVEHLLQRLAGEPRWPEPGDAWRHLRIEHRLGSGSDGVVYRAFDALLDREVALKLRLARAPAIAERLAEGQRMAKVDHPNVLKVHGVAEEGGFLGLWCDLIEGQVLSEWVDSGHRLGAAEIVTLGTELCAALAAIHRAGLVHGDVKAANVMRAQDGRYVLVDFGSSVWMGTPELARGTPLYLAPEVLEGGAPTAASDLYGLGALLFRLAAGRPPVEAETVEALIAGHRTGQRARLLDLRPDLPEPLVGALEAALDPEPARRPHSAGEFALRMARCLPQAVPRAPWRALAATAAVLLALAGFAWIYRTQPAPTPSASLRFVRTGGSFETGLSDGASIAPGDTFAMELRLPHSAYVYVINEDARGERFQLFPLPNARLHNPLPPHQDLRLPGDVDGGPLDWQVTSRGGMEHFYVVMSPHALPELEGGRWLELASRGFAIEYADALAAEPRRGVGGLTRPAHSAPSGSAFSQWIRQLQDRDASVQVEQLAFNNP